MERLCTSCGINIVNNKKFMDAHKENCLGPLPCVWTYPGLFVQEWFSKEGTPETWPDYAYVYVMDHKTGLGESKLLNFEQFKDVGSCFSTSLRTCYNMLFTDMRSFGNVEGQYPELDSEKIKAAMKKLVNDTDAADEDMDHDNDDDDFDPDDDQDDLDGASGKRWRTNGEGRTRFTEVSPLAPPPPKASGRRGRGPTGPALEYSLVNAFRVEVSDLKSRFLNSSGTVVTKELKKLENREYERVRVQLDPDENGNMETIYVPIEDLRVIAQVDPHLMTVH